ncbi:uncharacterized protein LOC114357792 [Ostrinia furnacalis]|uniref:uncharacterized protein LOC114357792 n=1 Tax=Ostrinia furnacalis TaxID=93504 RepID=UPI00104008E2|nr:uncharacterized protein LOC114357792 [Ostrinia furnacalis]
MNRHGFDSKVKKTLNRNCEQKTKPPALKETSVFDIGCSNLPTADRSSRSSQKENQLNQPSLCSSEALAHYLTDVKKSLPSPTPLEDIDKCQYSSKMTKKLNFHFNDRIYKNLIELNANVEDLKTKRDKRVHSASSSKRDMEPNIEDFYQDEIESDVMPVIPVIKPKFKPVKKVENGQLHRLIASFEDL